MEKNTKKTIFSFFVIGLFLLFIAGTFNNQPEIISESQRSLLVAQSSYQPISGIELNVNSEKTGFAQILTTIFGWGIAIAIVLAILVIVWGGIQYMTTDAFSEKTDGKEKIKGAVGGLILALVSWLILNTINPRILEDNFLTKTKEANQSQSGTPTNTSGSGATGTQTSPTTGTPGQDLQNPTQVKQNASSGITFDQNTQDYIDSNGLKTNTLNTINHLGDSIGSSENQVVVSAGTTDSFSINYSDNSDRSDSIDNYFVESFQQEYAIDGVEDIQTETPYVITIDGVENEVIKNSSGWFIQTTDFNTTGQVAPQETTEGADDVQTPETPPTNSSFTPENTSEEDGAPETPTNNSPEPVQNPEENQDQSQGVDSDSDKATLSEIKSESDFIIRQELASENIFVENQEANLVNLSGDLKSVLTEIRNFCCGLVTLSTGEITYGTSFNVTTIDSSQNSFLIEGGVVDERNYSSSNWRPITENLSENLYPNEYLIGSSKKCSIFNPFCNFFGKNITTNKKYESLEKKGVDYRDLKSGEVYRGEMSGVNFEATYGENSWFIQIKNV